MSLKVAPTGRHQFVAGRVPDRIMHWATLVRLAHPSLVDSILPASAVLNGPIRQRAGPTSGNQSVALPLAFASRHNSRARCFSARRRIRASCSASAISWRSRALPASIQRVNLSALVIRPGSNPEPALLNSPPSLHRLAPYCYQDGLPPLSPLQAVRWLMSKCPRFAT